MTSTRNINTKIRLLAVAGLCVSGSIAGPATAQAEADLPITSIMLYRSGVGSFLRQGEVTDDADVQLRFRTEQINDILKSMVVFDLGGGRVEGVTYGSKEPLSRRLAAFAIDISKNPSRAELLNQLRGARVAVTTAEGVTSGTVLGVEQRTVSDNEAGVTRQEAVLTLVTDRGMRSFEVEELRGFEILDEALAAELNKALLALAEHRADNTKAVGIGFSGDGDRPVAVSYVHETPVWKTSYRLVLPDGSADGSEFDTTVQGWAIVENTTDEDWEDVRLSLVSGRPVSFTMDLYEPLFVTRPEVPVPFASVAQSKAFGGGQAPAAAIAARGGGGFERGRMGLADDAEAAGIGLLRDVAGADLAVGEALMASALNSAASAESVGEVFQYTIDAPVTVARQQSAMLPILSGQIESERVSIYSAGDGGEHPMRGLRIRNETELQLMPGPIAVYDGSAYAGDAQISFIAPGDERLLAYAVDLDLGVRTESGRSQQITNIKIVNGLLIQTNRERATTTYVIDSNADGERTVVLEHPKRWGWEYVGRVKPSEEADMVDRFNVLVPAGKVQRTEIRQERTTSQSVGLLDADLNFLLTQQRNGVVSGNVISAFRTAAEKRDAVRAAERRIAQLNAEQREIAGDQSRLRQNIETVGEQSDLYARYIRKLGEQEDRLEEIANEQRVAQLAKADAERELTRYLSNLSVE
ncbi:MAG: hypothetical protein AAF747_00980 [Planctomycetota bacterium]